MNYMDYEITATIGPEWQPIDKPIQVNDVCAIASLKQEYLCGYKTPYEQFEYLFFGNLYSDDLLFAVQTKVNKQYYVRVLNKKPEKVFALRLFKKVRQNET